MKNKYNMSGDEKKVFRSIKLVENIHAYHLEMYCEIL